MSENERQWQSLTEIEVINCHHCKHLTPVMNGTGGREYAERNLALHMRAEHGFVTEAQIRVIEHEAERQGYNNGLADGRNARKAELLNEINSEREQATSERAAYLWNRFLGRDA